MGVTARRCTVVAGRHRTPSAATSEQVRKFRCLPHQGGGLCRTLFSTAIYDPNHSFFARRDTPYTTRGDGWTRFPVSSRIEVRPAAGESMMGRACGGLAGTRADTAGEKRG